MSIAFVDEDGRDIRNTASMRMKPESPVPFHTLENLESGDRVEFLPVMSGDAFRRLVRYPIVVECWDKKNYGRHRRAWHATFTQAERNKISRYYGRFYKWYLVTGTPRRVLCRLDTLELLQRAVDFFAELS